MEQKQIQYVYKRKSNEGDVKIERGNEGGECSNCWIGKETLGGGLGPGAVFCFVT